MLVGRTKCPVLFEHCRSKPVSSNLGPFCRGESLVVVIVYYDSLGGGGVICGEQDRGSRVLLGDIGREINESGGLRDRADIVSAAEAGGLVRAMLVLRARRGECGEGASTDGSLQSCGSVSTPGMSSFHQIVDPCVRSDRIVSMESLA